MSHTLPPTAELLQYLSDAFGPSGFEEEVRERITALVTPLVDEVRVDALGNLFAIRRGTGDRTLMLDAHMDEIGFMVTYIEEQGFLRVAPLGGWDQRVVPAHQLVVRADDGSMVRGVFGSPPPHLTLASERDRAFKLDDLFVDIGATSVAEVAELGIHVGSPAVMHYPFAHLQQDAVLGKAFDDRAGCAVILMALAALQNEAPEVTIAAAFTVQEEVGLRGAEVAARQIAPDIALALECTIAADVPGIPTHRTPTRQGKGPSISVLDNTMIGMPRVINALTGVANAEGLRWQYKVPAPGGTDAGVIHRSGSGVLTGVVSLPGRYIHSASTVVRTGDIEQAAALVAAFARACPGVVGL